MCNSLPNGTIVRRMLKSDLFRMEPLSGWCLRAISSERNLYPEGGYVHSLLNIRQLNPTMTITMLEPILVNNTKSQ